MALSQPVVESVIVEMTDHLKRSTKMVKTSSDDDDDVMVVQETLVSFEEKLIQDNEDETKVIAMGITNNVTLEKEKWSNDEVVLT